MRRVVARAVVTGAMLAAGAAHAQPGDGEKKAAAQALFDEARTLSASGKHAEACPKLAESLRLDPSMGTRFYLAECLEHTGKLASAWTYYLEVADGARAAGQKDREKFAADRAEALRPRLPRLSIQVPKAARAAGGLEIKRNGVVVGAAQWGVAIPIDLGPHAISARAPGKKAWATEVIAKQEGESLAIVVPALAVPASPPPPRVAKIDPPAPPPPPPSAWPARRIGGVVVGVAGAASLVASFAVGAAAISKKSASNEPGGGCDEATNVCNAKGLATRNEGLALATGSTVAFVAGLAAIGTGVVLIVTSKPHAPAAAIGPSGGSLTWSF